MEKEYLGVKQTAVYLTFSPIAIYTYIHYQSIPFIKRSERIVFEKDRLDQWVKSKTKGGIL
jgi:hypothetical protein